MNSEAKQDISARRRQVDLNSVSEEQADLIAAEIGRKIGESVNETCEKARKLLNIYGLDIKLTYVVFKQGEDPLAEKPKKRTRKPKAVSAE